MKKTFITHQELSGICQSFPTPFHLYDEDLIRQRARKLKEAFAWNPGYQEYFAVKANPNPVILDILLQEGMGADCSSYTELLLARASGFRGHQIMFSSNVTPRQDMALAAELGSLINLDDISHISFLENLAGIPENLVLRFNPGNSFIIGNSIMSRPGDAKYGCTRNQLLQGMRILKDKGCKGLGIHAFLSSNTSDPDYYPALARLLFQTAVDIQESCGIALKWINLSGGISIPYKPDDAEVDIIQIGQEVHRAYQDIMEPAGLGTTAIQTELGRWLLAPAGCLVSRVIHEKHIYKDYLGLDACAANLLRPAMYGAYHHITVPGQEDQPDSQIWDVTGGLCENNDKFAIDRPLPSVGIGDLVVIHDTGAHGHSMGYNYNGKLRSAEVLLKTDRTTRLIRRAETPADYFATLDVIDGLEL